MSGPVRALTPVQVAGAEGVVTEEDYSLAKEAWFLAELRLVRAERAERQHRAEANAASARLDQAYSAPSHDEEVTDRTIAIAQEAWSRANERACHALAAQRRQEVAKDAAYEAFMRVNRGRQATLEAALAAVGAKS